MSFQLEEESVWEVPEGAPSAASELWAEKKKKLRLVVKPSLADAARAAAGPPKPSLADFIKKTTDVDAESMVEAVEERVTQIKERVSSAGNRVSTAFGIKQKTSGKVGQLATLDEEDEGFAQQAHGWAAIQKKGIKSVREIAQDTDEGTNILSKNRSLLDVAQAEKQRQLQERRDSIAKKKKELEAKKALITTMQKQFTDKKEEHKVEVSVAAGRFKKLGTRALKDEGVADAEDAWFALEGAED